MKKKQLLALALVGAMSATTAAKLAPAKVYAEETVSAKEKLVELVEGLKTSFPTFSQTLEMFDTKEEVKKLSESQVKELTEIFTELKVLTGKKIGSLEFKTTVLEAEEAIKDKNMSYMGQVPGATDLNSLIAYRAAALKHLEEHETKAVKDAEKAYEVAKKAFEAVSSTDYTELANKAQALKNAETALDTAKAAEVAAMDAILKTISDVENSKRLPVAVASVKARFVAAMDAYAKKVDLNTKKNAYLKANEILAKYETSAKLEEAKQKIQKEFDKYKEEFLAKINRQVKANEALEDADIVAYIEETLVDAEKKILIENNVTKAEIEEYAKKHNENVKFQAMIFGDKTAVETAKTAYNTANEALKKAQEALDKADKTVKDSISNLDFVVDFNKSAIQYKSYEAHLRTVNRVAAKLEVLAQTKNDAKKALDEAKETVANAETALAKDAENSVLQTELNTAKSVLETKVKAFEKAEKEFETVKADLERLSSMKKDLHAKFRMYADAAIKGAGNYELKLMREALEENLKRFNAFAADYNLPKVTVERPATEVSGTWSKVDGVWYYKDAKSLDVYKNAWGKIDGKWYKFDEKGAMLESKWYKEDGKWYWLKSNGSMASNEWVLVNGEWFWANASGRIAENEWVLVDGKWYFAKSGGYIAINVKLEINGKVYKFDKSGALV